MDNLILDRLKIDVDNALNNPSNPSFLKGAYNYTDLNRVETWCEYIKDILNEYGKNVSIQTKTNWNMRDYPTRTQIDRIRDNLDTLKEACYSLTTEEILYNNTLNYEQANTLEKILYDIDTYIKKNNRKSYGKGSIGAIVVRTNCCSFLIDTHKRYAECKTSMKVACFLSRTKYIELKGEC